MSTRAVDGCGKVRSGTSHLTRSIIRDVVVGGGAIYFCGGSK